jgi:hypothetical protein
MSKAKIERTSAEVAKLAGEILKASYKLPDNHAVIAMNRNAMMAYMELLSTLGLDKDQVTWLGDVRGIQSVCGSALTQTADKKR